MHKHPWTSVAILVSVLICAAQGTDKTPSAFKQLQALAGDWEGKDASGTVAKTSFKIVVANTTVMETLVAQGMEEMLTLYTVDGDGVALVHYCPTNNQPRMRAVPKTGNVNWTSSSPEQAIFLILPWATSRGSCFDSTTRTT
jgi:hypothetical protein